MVNRVVIVGRLTRDPEVRTTNTGKSVASFSVAVNKRFKPQDGSPDADFFNCSAWEKTADYVGNYLTKGRLVAVEGRLSTRKYTAKDGTERDVVEIVADSVSALDRPKDDSVGGGAAAGGQDNAPRAKAAAIDEYDPFADE